jgi:hypothetical protein
MSEHCVGGVGAIPTGTGEQVPAVPCRLQARHAAEQPSLQQTPCSQYPDLHMPADVQGVPFSCCTHTLPVQL